MLLPNYDKSLVALANSILKEFKLTPLNNTYDTVDKLLSTKKYQNIVVLLLDGLGSCVLNENLAKDSFFQSHKLEDYSSVFPPTTVAATTSIKSGLAPNQHAWLGWDCYYPQIDENVTVFLNTIQGTDQKAADYMVAEKFCPYDSVVDLIKKSGQQAYEVSPHSEPYPQTFEQIITNIKELCNQEGKKYIYAYWEDPDHTMHPKGVNSQETNDVIKDLEAKVESLANELSDNTLLIITADHGMRNTRGININNYPEITNLLERPISIEPRAVNFFVKEGKNEEFVETFNKLFGDEFKLFTKDEVLELNLFGDGKEHANFQKMLGDYLAIATKDLCICNNDYLPNNFIGAHAGITKEELTIPLIIAKK